MRIISGPPTITADMINNCNITCSLCGTNFVLESGDETSCSFSNSSQSQLQLYVGCPTCNSACLFNIPIGVK